jgi:DNA-binding transcriptional LysR family regulator
LGWDHLVRDLVSEGRVVQMALDGQGMALGWDHLVRDLVSEGRLVRPVTEELTLSEALQYLIVKEEKAEDPACLRLKDWLIEHFA